MKWFKRIFLLLILTGVFSVAGSTIYVFWHLDEKFEGQAECAVVFGAAVWRDDIPTQALYDRTMSGIQLYKNHQVKCLIFSGGPSHMGAHEVEVMQKMALEAGVNSADIRLDYHGENSLATIKNLPAEVRSFVMVSNDFHLARIKILAQKFDINPVYLHAATYHEGLYDRRSYYFFREIFGIILYFLFSFFLF